jgi:hypothetical protein
MSKTKCPECGEEFKKLGSHWVWKTEHRPKIKKLSMEILKGLVMGDGCVRNRDSEKPRVTVVNFTNKEYLHYLKSVQPSIWGEITKMKDHGYRISSVAHPSFTELSDWYDGSDKIWPETVEVTKTVLKHLYVTDGNLDTNRKSPVVRISASNQSENEENFINAVGREEIPEPRYSEPNFYWSVDETKDFFNYIGEPVPGFEYKWPKEYRNN